MSIVNLEERRKHQIKLLHDAEEITIFRRHFKALSAELRAFEERHKRAAFEGLKLRQQAENL
jgi:hypothetical protein